MDGVGMMANLLYKIYYGEWVAYLGRTKQPLQTRLRGHFFSKPMHKKIDIESVNRIEYAECKTVADMYLYEVYYINLLTPPINCDDKAADGLTIALPDLDWEQYDCPLIDKWKAELAGREIRRKVERQKELDKFDSRRELRKRHANGELSDDEYEELLLTVQEGSNNDG